MYQIEMNNKILRVFYNIVSMLCKPFTEELRFFIISLLMSGLMDIISQYIIYSFPKSVFIGLHHYLLCYLVTFAIFLLPSGIRFTYKCIMMILFGLNFIIDASCLFSFHYAFNVDIAGILLGTNFHEALEFMATFVSFRLIAVIFFTFLIILFLYNILGKLSFKQKKVIVYICNIFLVISIIGYLKVDWSPFGYLSLTKISTFIRAMDVPDLEKYKHSLSLIDITDKKPKNVVIIMGESFSKSHSSLYGYNKKTNPLLQTLIDNESMFVFRNVSSPAITTIECFKSIMSTYKPEYKDSINWYECITIYDILRNVKYETHWISNQSESGFYDNIVTKYAMLSDDFSFVGKKLQGVSKDDLDEIILDTISKFKNLNDCEDNNFYLIHLMGSHPKFNKRYSERFDVFKKDDYSDRAEIQRIALAEYDNSILYNDSVVYEIINKYKDDESIIFYFSDHALDIFDSRDDFFGHGRYNDKKSFDAASQIPFMVYMSQKYQENFPEERERIKHNVNKKFRTDDMIYTIMDIIGVEFEDNNHVVKYSLFR